MGWPNRTAIRTTITHDEVSGFGVKIGPERNLWQIAFLSIWLAGWAVGEFAILSWIVLVPALLVCWEIGAVPPEFLTKMLHDARRRFSWAEIFFIVFIFFPFWTLAGIITFREWRWQLGGREVITIHEGVLELRREVGLRHHSHMFDLLDIHNLRYAPEPTDSVPSLSFNKPLRDMLRVEGGNIAFNHDGRTHRFGIGLTETEACRLIATIRERFKIVDDGWEPLPVES